MAATELRESARSSTTSRRTDALVAKVEHHHRAISTHQQQLLTAVAELERRKAWRVDGATSMVAWLVQRCAVTAATARDWTTTGSKLPQLPHIADALARGKLSFDQVKSLVEVATPEADAELAEKATHWSAKQVRELANEARKKTNDQAASSYYRRFLRFNDRRCSFSGALPDDQYAFVKGTLFGFASRRKKSDITFDQRMSDSLVELCQGGGVGGGKAAGVVGSPPSRDAGGARRNRPTVVVHADLTFLAGGEGTADLDVLGPLAPEVARRLACDARIIVSGDDPDGRSIQQGGARRSPTSAQRREIRRRDKGCRFPGCTHTEFTDVHHVIHWTNNGPTDIGNLIELCDQHHRAAHELGWKMSGDANVEITFRSPTGRLTTSTPSPTFNRSRAGPPG